MGARSVRERRGAVAALLAWVGENQMYTVPAFGYGLARVGLVFRFGGP